VAEEVKIPIILYNIPGRTGINVNPETIVALAKDCKNIVGVKEASETAIRSARLSRRPARSFLSTLATTP